MVQRRSLLALAVADTQPAASLVATCDVPCVKPVQAQLMFTFERMQSMAVHAANAPVNAAVSRLANVHGAHAADGLVSTGQSTCADDEQDAMHQHTDNVVPLKRAAR